MHEKFRIKYVPNLILWFQKLLQKVLLEKVLLEKNSQQFQIKGNQTESEFAFKNDHQSIKNVTFECPSMYTLSKDKKQCYIVQVSAGPNSGMVLICVLIDDVRGHK